MVLRDEAHLFLRKQSAALILAFLFVVLIPASVAASNDAGNLITGFPTLDGEPIFKVHLVVPSVPAARFATAQLIAERLTAIGIDTEIHVVPFSELVRILFPDSLPGPPGPPPGWDMGTIGFGVGLLPSWRLAQCGSPSNFAGYCNPVYDELGFAQERELDPAIRANLLFQLQEKFVQDRPISVLFSPRNVWAMNRDLTRFDGSLLQDRVEVWEGLEQVVFAIPISPQRFNPLFSRTIWDGLAAGPAFESLWIREAHPRSPNFREVVASLAEGQEHLVPVDPSDPSKGYRVTVNLESSYFADGHPVDGFDVAFTLQMLRHPTVNSEGRSFYDSLGVTAVPEPRRVAFHFPTFPGPDFRLFLSFSILPMHYWVPHEPSMAAAAYRTDGNYPVLPTRTDSFNTGIDTFGSGPYQGTSGKIGFDPSSGRVTLFAHERSHTKQESVVNYQLRTIPGVDTAIAALKAGEVDIIHTLYGYEKRRAELASTPGIRVETFSTASIQVMGYNFNNQHLKNSAVRNAIDFVIPRSSIINDIFDGLADMTSSFIPPASPFFDSRFGAGGSHGPIEDVCQARTLLRDAGYPVLAC